MGRSRDAECPAVLGRIPYNKQLSGCRQVFSVSIHPQSITVPGMKEQLDACLN